MSRAFTNAMDGTPAAPTVRHIRSVPTLAPSTAEITSTVPSSAGTVISASGMKFGSPGVSTTVTCLPFQSKA